MPDRRIFNELLEFLKLGIPGVLLLGLDITGNVTVNTLSGWISTEV